MRARLVDRRIGRDVVLRHNIVREHPRFDFLAADVGQHVAVDLDARAQHLTGLLDHFLTLQRVVDDVAVFVRQVVLFQHGADALAPAAGRFQVSDDFWFAHSFVKIVLTLTRQCHRCERRANVLTSDKILH
jgi:hypothetical protein